MRKSVLLLALFSAGCGAAADTEEASQAAETATPVAAPATASISAEGTAMLETIRTATARYADLNAALSDGFTPDPTGHCVRAEDVGQPAELGAMGLHFAHPARLGVQSPDMPVTGSDPVLDWNQPEVLLYEPQADGSMRLVAVEYLIFQDAWQTAGNTAAPDFYGAPFVAMADDPATPIDEAHGFAPHYELHVWLQAENPNGIFAEFNPAVNCAHAAAHTPVSGI